MPGQGRGQHAAAGAGQSAIIDIGSNTVRLVIYGGPARAPQVLYNEKVTARLGKGVAEHGRLSDKPMGIALAALGRYALLLRLRGVAEVVCVATAAVRDASNGPEFLARVAALGLDPRLLSGEDEALTGAGGVCAAFPGAMGVVGDLGGGSLELTDVAGDLCAHGVSLPLGTLRLAAMRAAGPAKFARRVKKLLRTAQWAGAHGQTLYLVGGSWRALARVAMNRADWPVDDPHGFELAPDAALTLLRSLTTPKRAKAGDRPKSSDKPGVAVVELAQEAGSLTQQGISLARVGSLPDAAALLAVLVRELKPARLVFSGWGLREGVLAGRMSRATRAADPLREGVRAFVAESEPALLALAPGVLRWTMAASPAPAGAERLREVACLLALATARTEPNRRGAQALDWALRKRWIGIDAEGRAMVAMAIRANAGRSVIPPQLLRLAPPARLREALAWGLATRLCRRLTAIGLPAMEATALTMEDGGLVLSLRGDHARLFTDTVEKDLRQLAECLGVEWSVRVV